MCANQHTDIVSLRMSMKKELMEIDIALKFRVHKFFRSCVLIGVTGMFRAFSLLVPEKQNTVK